MKRLKYIDAEVKQFILYFKLDKENANIYELCRQLDSVDDSIRDLLVSKIDDHLHRAEPLFETKQR